MIHLHRLNGQAVVINAELIETVESHGQETVIRLTTANSFLVKESVEDVLARNLEYRQNVQMERRSSCL
jgi:uncharacterized protein YlzI (FlbEa/FlbD family)